MIDEQLETDITELETQLNNVVTEIEKLAILGTTLKAHKSENKHLWTLSNDERFKEILKKCKNVDEILTSSF